MMTNRLIAILACALLAGCTPGSLALADGTADVPAAPQTQGTTVRYSVPAVVTFVDGDDETTQDVEVGEPAQDPGHRNREGYEFLGWFDAATGERWDFSTPVTDHMTLVARWQAAERPRPSTGGGRDGGSASDAPASPSQAPSGQLAKTGDDTPVPVLPALFGAGALLGAGALRARAAGRGAR